MASRLSRSLSKLDALRNWEAKARDEMRNMVGTEPCADLLRLLGHPQAALRKVHVAGSKGKGSAAALAAAALERGGYRVASLTSPHVECVTERLTICGAPVAPDALASALERTIEARAEAVRRATDGGHATWFDTFVAASLYASATAAVDWTVVECGLGGRTDSTNVLDAELALLTSVELEHTEVLGGTLAEIASEKAAIAARGGALVACAPAEAEDAIRRVAEARRVGSLTLLPVTPDRMADNVALVRAALDELGERGSFARGGFASRRLGSWLLDDTLVASTLRRLPARQESLRSRCGVNIVLDVAHTSASAASLVEAVERGALPSAVPSSSSPPVALVGLAPDKDYSAVASSLSELNLAHVLCLHELPPRGSSNASLAAASGKARASGEALADAFRAAGCREVETLGGDLAEQLENALESARSRKTWLLVVGSNKLAGEVRPRLRPRT